MSVRETPGSEEMKDGAVQALAPAPLRPVPPGLEQRRHARIPRPPLRVSGIWGWAHDISLGGLSLVTSEAIEPGHQYQIILVDTYHYTNQELRVEVVWIGEGRAGMRWVDLSPDQEVWLQSCFEAWTSEPQLALLEYSDEDPCIHF